MAADAKWKTVSSAYVYENPWIRVRHDEVIRPDGKKGIYGIVEGRDIVCVIPRQGDMFYMVEQYRYAVKERSLEFPKGGIEPHERAIDAAHRELEEEAGLRCKSLEKLGFLYLGIGHQTIGYSIYAADDCTPGTQNLEGTELGMEIRRLSRAQIQERIRNGSIVDSATVAAFGLYMLHRD